LCFVSVLCGLFELVDHGGRRGNTAQALTRWWHPVASSEAWDVLHRAMRPTLYRCIAMATEIVVDLPAFFVSSISLLATTISSRPCYGQYKINKSYQYDHHYVINRFLLHGRSPSMMDAVSDTICGGGKAIRRKHDK